MSSLIRVSWDDPEQDSLAERLVEEACDALMDSLIEAGVVDPDISAQLHETCFTPGRMNLPSRKAALEQAKQAAKLRGDPAPGLGRPRMGVPRPAPVVANPELLSEQTKSFAPWPPPRGWRRS